MKHDLFDDWKFKEDMRMHNDPIGPMQDPIDLRPLHRTLDMQENFRKPMPEPRDPMRDIRPEPIGPLNISRGVDMRPLDDMLMFQKKGVF